MKSLIAYASKTGVVEKCAKMLAEKLPGVEICNLRRGATNPADYDCVVVGGSIRAGALSPETALFLDQCRDTLLRKKLGLFLCCGADDQAEEAFSRNIAPELLAHAAVHMAFGGELNLDGAHGLERWMMKFMRKSAEKEGTLMHLFPERMDAFAAALEKEES